jgi:hypothetical protein
MDIIFDKPLYSRQPSTGDKKTEVAQELPSYISWLESGKDDCPLLQVVLIRVLEAQISTHQFKAWIKLPFRITYAIFKAAFKSMRDTTLAWRTQVAESRLFHNKVEARLPAHSKLPPIFTFRRD